MPRAIEKLASGRYKVRYRHNGKETSQTWDRKRDAERFRDLLTILGPQGALDQIYGEQLQAAIPTLTAVALDHIDLLTDAEPGTKLNYQRLWARTWGPLIGDLPANRLTQDDVKRAVNTLADRYSEKSLKNQRGLLAAVCDRVVDLGHLPKNPAKRLRLPRAREVERADMRILSRDEFATVLDGINPHYQPFVRFLAGTGARYGEAVALTVTDCPLPDVRIRRALKWSPDNQRRVGPPKTKRGNRTIRLPGEVEADVRQLCAGRPPTDLVFTAPKGGPINHRTFWSDIWLPAVRDLVPRPRIHDLRHSHAAWLLANGIPIHIVSRRLGHESIKTTVDVYGGLLPDAQLAAAAAADAVFGVLD
jgi:integrase